MPAGGDPTIASPHPGSRAGVAPPLSGAGPPSAVAGPRGGADAPRGLGRYLQPKQWFASTASAPAVTAASFDPDPAADVDGVARWLADVLRVASETSGGGDSPRARDGGSGEDDDLPPPSPDALAVDAAALLSRWRAARASDANRRDASSSSSPSAPSPSSSSSSSSALERAELAESVAAAVKHLLKAAAERDDRGFRRAEPRPPVCDATSDGAVTRLREALRAALDHGAKPTWGEVVGRALRRASGASGGGAPLVGEWFAKKNAKNTHAALPGMCRSAAPALEAFERKYVSGERSVARALGPDRSVGGYLRDGLGEYLGGLGELVAGGGGPVARDGKTRASSPARTPAGKTRAWIHAGLERGDLGDRVAALGGVRELVAPGRGSYYDPGALLADEEATGRVAAALRGLQALPFDRAPGGDALDAFEESAEEVARREKEAEERREKRANAAAENDDAPSHAAAENDDARDSLAAAAKLLLRFRARVASSATGKTLAPPRVVLAAAGEPIGEPTGEPSVDGGGVEREENEGAEEETPNAAPSFLSRGEKGILDEAASDDDFFDDDEAARRQSRATSTARLGSPSAAAPRVDAGAWGLGFRDLGSAYSGVATAVKEGAAKAAGGVRAGAAGAVGGAVAVGEGVIQGGSAVVGGVVGGANAVVEGAAGGVMQTVGAVGEVMQTVGAALGGGGANAAGAEAAASGAKAAATEEEEAFLLDMREVLTTEPEAETRM